ncbi:MAG TPA: PA2779 family protein [Vicinamibacteria bacterium]
MTSHRLPARLWAAALTVSLSAVGAPRLRAATHVVAPEQIAKRLLAAAETREAKLRLVRDALATPEAQKQARALGLDPQRLQSAVPHLSDAELRDLEARAVRAKDVRAGHGADGLAILGILLLIAGVAVLLAAADDGYYDDYCYCY